jgi:hypothetical protein
MPTVIPNSTFLDFTSHGMTTATNVVDAYGLSGNVPATHSINVALVLARANDPTSLLSSDWGSRQQQLHQLENEGTLWSTYGADQTDYDNVVNTLTGMGITILGDANGTGGYITSQESRTVWASLTPAQFEAFFGRPLYHADIYGYDTPYWEGSLSLPDGVDVKGLWFDTLPVWGTYPAVSLPSSGSAASLPLGPQSIGNSLEQSSSASAGDIARWYYKFPLTGLDVPTATIGLVEPTIGTALPEGTAQTFQERLDIFRHDVGISSPGEFYVVAPNGQSYTFGASNPGERSLDVGVVTSANPNSKMGFYVGSGIHGGATSNAYTAYQAAFWDQAHNPPVVTSSFGIFQQASPDSPFAYAARELFVDAALRNISTFIANNDWGSSYNFSNGLANQNPTLSSPYAVLVGGTSLTTVAAAPHDPTVEHLYGDAVAGQMAVLWQLMQGGLMEMPRSLSHADALQATLIEAVWNTFSLRQGEHGKTILTPAPSDAAAGDGGVDTEQPTPWYQTAFGLTPTSANPGHETGRGAPDVAAIAGGNFYYWSPWADMTSYGTGGYGTSASTPLWASLTAQIDTIFHDQGLPSLGFMNDLLYMAAAIAPASFNDITFGNNVSSMFYVDDGPTHSGNSYFTLTGLGYAAGPGYDLTSGLGTPNGTLLARALTAIGHAQMSGTSPDMLDADGSGWQSGADQSLMFQAMTPDGGSVDIGLEDHGIHFGTSASGAYAWTSRLAQQALQADFDPHLVRLFDKQAQGWVAQSTVATGEYLSVRIDGASAHASQGSLSSPFGFADFVSSDGAVRVARPVAVAETAGGADDQVAVVRVRQNGENKLSVTFYKVDDLAGTIGDKTPGHDGYAAAADVRAYHLGSGDTSLNGPGYGNYEQAMLVGIDNGDHIAMKLTNQTTGAVFWAFATANEQANGQPVGHLWNYGLNTWGWEDMFGGGDRDFNDLIVQLDFTSASGHGWLI